MYIINYSLSIGRVLSNYFTLYHISRRLNELLSGFTITEIYSQEKNTLCIVVYTGELYTLKISCEGSSNFISCKPGNQRAKKNSIDIFPLYVGSKIESVFIHPHDRILFLPLSGGETLVVEMFRSKANIFICSSNGIITDAFLHKKEYAGKEYFLSARQKIEIDNFCNERSFLKNISESENILSALKKSIPVLGPTLAKEILFRAGISEGAALAEAGGQTKNILLEISSVLLSELLNEKNSQRSFIYSEEKIPVCFSIIPLKQFAELERREFPSLFEGIYAYIGKSRSAQSFTEKKKEMISWLEKEIAKNEQTLVKIRKEANDALRAEQYELWGKLIQNNFHIVKKGMKFIDAENIFSHNETVHISLDPSLSPAQNAERYFDKAKKAKQSIEETAQRITFLENRKKIGLELLEEFREIETSISLKNLLLLRNDQFRLLGYMTEKEQEELPPFKIFTVEGGFTVYAGKSSENNDLLTVKFAKPNDLWFHARGSSGSHVVLKTGSANGEPSKKAIEQAASIAAYYSKMKNARNVPVAMTEKKYVRKPKGVPAGTVVIEREKVIFVEPKLPDNGK